MLKPEQLVDGLCNQPHLGYVLEGEISIEMKDGEKYYARAGSIADIPPGHDAIVTSNTSCSILDLTGKAPEM